MNGLALAQSAEQLVGCRFRLHGRDPTSGLDCIGVLAAALATIGRTPPIPTGYAWRMRSLDGWLPDPGACGFVEALGPVTPGDVVLLQPASGQFHLAIAANCGGWVHAHAGLRRVILTADRPDGATIGRWRLNPDR